MKNDGAIGRRDFMRAAAAAAAVTTSISGPGGAATSANPASPSATPRSPNTFVESKRIPVAVDNPSALAVGAGGKLYVAGENAVAVLDADGKETARRNVKGRPGCLALAADGRLFAGLRDHVEVLDAKGAVAASWQDLGDRAWLTSIAADDENVYVADAGNRIVLRYAFDGTLKNRIGERDKERGVPGLLVPSPYFDVAIDPQGALWVVNPGKHGLENYRPNGDLMSSWYRTGMEMEAFCGCCNPIHIAFRSDNSLVTAEKGLSRVKVYAPDTTLLGVVSAEAAPPIAENKALFCNVEPPIMDLAVDSKDRILVLNKPEKAIIVYEESTK